MQALDAMTLRHLAAELDQLLAHAKVSKIQHPSAHEFLLTFWGGRADRGTRNQLYLNLHPQFSVCTLLDRKEKTNFIRQDFSKPTTFCMLLRKHLGSANLLSINTLPGERVLNLTFDNLNELGNRVRLVLSLELMGKHSNMILYDELEESILGVAHGVGEHQSQFRELAAGLPYLPPPQPVKKRPIPTLDPADLTRILGSADPTRWPELLVNTLEGLGTRMAEDIVQLSQSTTEVYHWLTTLYQGQNLAPAIYCDHTRFRLLPIPPEGSLLWVEQPSVVQMVHDYFTHLIRTTRLTQQHQALEKILTTQYQRLIKRETELTPPESSVTQDLQHQGDLLLAALSAGRLPSVPKKGQVKVQDYLTNALRTIEIDPSLSWVDNAQLYYRRAKKTKARQDAFLQQQEALQNDKLHLQELLLRLNQAENLEDLKAVRREMEDTGLVKRHEQEKTTKSKPSGAELSGIRALQSSDGFPLLVGRSGQGNADLVGKIARGEDLWLHVHQMPGSHVLIKTDRKTVEEIPKQTLLEAANLAVYYSAGREGKNVPVIYTQCKYVRKIPGSYPGHVNYYHEKTVFITPEPDLLNQLLQKSEPALPD